jgi:hypothetical protein
MYTEKERKQLERALKRVEKCSGDCKHCEKCHIYTSEKSFCYAIGCDLLPQNMFDMIDDHITTLRQTAIDLLKFELS